MVDLVQLSVDLALKHVETALRESRHPLPDDLALVLLYGRATLQVQQYLVDNFERKPPSGRPSLSGGASDVKMFSAITLIRREHDKARANGVEITISEAVKKAARRGLAGFGKSSLWEAVRRYKDLYREGIF